uniref:Uncharacterized protein n=1 Tax=Meloidogyne enterolobii TaxID=390850 RepID=A0A6V7V288_MELEN|nr:unnamed protein product [Meloidogyne enterolobii]
MVENIPQAISSITSLLLALIIGIGLLYLFVRLNLVFRVWKASARLVLFITQLLLCFATQAPGGPYGREKMQTSTYVNFGLEPRLNTLIEVSTTSTLCLDSRRTYGKIWHTHLEKLAPPTLLTNLTTTNLYQWSRPLLAIKAQLSMPSIHHFNLEKLLMNMVQLLTIDQIIPNQLDSWLDYHHPGWNRDEKTKFEAGVAIVQILETESAELKVLTAERTVRRSSRLAGFTELPANKELIMPNCTVDRHYWNKGVTLIRPDLPCMIFGNPLERANRHGFRGSSAKSLSRNRGKACWRQGERHYELIPPERIYWIKLKQTARDNEQHFGNVSAQPEHNTDGEHATPKSTANRTSTPNEYGTFQVPKITISPVIAYQKPRKDIEPFDNGGFNQWDSNKPIEPMAGPTLNNIPRNVRQNVQSTTRPHSITRQSRRGMDNRPQSTTNHSRSTTQPQVPTNDMPRQSNMRSNPNMVQQSQAGTMCPHLTCRQQAPLHIKLMFHHERSSTHWQICINDQNLIIDIPNGNQYCGTSAEQCQCKMSMIERNDDEEKEEQEVGRR